MRGLPRQVANHLRKIRKKLFMPHPLENKYDLSATELLDAINRRFRAKVTLEGAVAEVHLEKKLKALRDERILTRYKIHDSDGYPDFTIWLPGNSSGQLIECKNVRNADEAYRQKGDVVAYKVETQKTRTSNQGPSTRYYDKHQFAILAVCMGKKTGKWTDFMFIRSRNLKTHRSYPNKLAVMHRVPLPNSNFGSPWYGSLKDLLEDQPT